MVVVGGGGGWSGGRRGGGRCGRLAFGIVGSRLGRRCCSSSSACGSPARWAGVMLGGGIDIHLLLGVVGDLVLRSGVRLGGDGWAVGRVGRGPAAAPGGVAPPPRGRAPPPRGRDPAGGGGCASSWLASLVGGPGVLVGRRSAFVLVFISFWACSGILSCGRVFIGGGGGVHG